MPNDFSEARSRFVGKHLRIAYCGLGQSLLCSVLSLTSCVRFINVRPTAVIPARVNPLLAGGGRTRGGGPAPAGGVCVELGSHQPRPLGKMGGPSSRGYWNWTCPPTNQRSNN